MDDASVSSGEELCRSESSSDFLRDDEVEEVEDKLDACLRAGLTVGKSGAL